MQARMQFSHTWKIHEYEAFTEYVCVQVHPDTKSDNHVSSEKGATADGGPDFPDEGPNSPVLTGHLFSGELHKQ